MQVSPSIAPEAVTELKALFKYINETKVDGRLQTAIMAFEQKWGLEDYSANASGEMCPQCGVAMRQTGKCFTCPQCGTNQGCS